MKEYADFLGAHAPYDSLDAADLEQLARNVEVEYFTAGAMIIPADAAALDRLYVVRAGAVDVLDRGRVVDLLGPGDTFGHVSLLSGLPPALAVRAEQDTLCYLLPDPRRVLGHPAALRFAHYGTLIARERLAGEGGLLDHGNAPVSVSARPVVWCDAADAIADVAARITQARQSCAVVRTPGGFGIVTDSDFRHHVATGRVPAHAPVGGIATMPARTVASSATVAEAFLQMVEHDVHHLPMVDSDGTPTGMVRVVDLASVEVRDPLMISSAVRHAPDVSALAAAAKLLPSAAVALADAGVPPLRLAALLATVRDAIMRRLISWDAGAEATGAECAWLVLGSTARSEPFPGSDLDTAVAWADEPGKPEPADLVLAAAGRLLDDMELCGLRRCPDGANATERLFSRSAADWKAAASRWVGQPTGTGTALLVSIIADSRPLTAPALGRSVTAALLAAIRSFDFIEGVLHLALHYRPPTGFVRDFVVEHSGEHRGELNLKRGGLVPIASIARWAAIVTGDVAGSTVERLSRAEQAGLLTQDEAASLTGAYEEIFGLLLAREIDAIRAGAAPSKYLAPGDLGSLTRRLLRETFRVISQVQATLEGEWVSRVR
ncbi:MAG TPA: putative nucleotidyltransferase substrate binding domain-containing protein [Streptosporangiaceae bacterium]|nr:putative nucleotidyltransferase substrate binding domain-containing protein [Streptosporangiaceae bacterium]